MNQTKPKSYYQPVIGQFFPILVFLIDSFFHIINFRTGENVYTTAIRTVGDILQDYDYGKIGVTVGMF